MKRLLTALDTFGAAEGGAQEGTQAAQETAAEPVAKAADNSGVASTKENGGLPERAGDEETTAKRVMAAARLAARAKVAAAAAGRWEREAEALKGIYPSFSLEEALRTDETFTALLRAGLPVRTAYEAAHLEEIIGSAMRYAAGAAGRRAAHALREGAGRVRENPVLGRAGTPSKRDVNSLTEKDIFAILRQVGNGKKITF